jgi:hypothetical protein
MRFCRNQTNRLSTHQRRLKDYFENLKGCVLTACTTLRMGSRTSLLKCVDCEYVFSVSMNS